MCLSIEYKTLPPKEVVGYKIVYPNGGNWFNLSIPDAYALRYEVGKSSCAKSLCHGISVLKSLKTAKKLKKFIEGGECGYQCKIIKVKGKNVVKHGIWSFFKIKGLTYECREIEVLEEIE